MENPVFKDLTFLIDCSRNGVVNFENFKTLATRLALLGYTSLQIYTEDTLELEDEPYFGHLRGRFSPAELKEMDDFADSVGIELVPYIQTLAHFDNIFLWPEYYKVWDIYNTILIGDDNTYALIEKIFKALRGSLRTKKVNIGFDEAHFVLRGKYADQKGFPADKNKIVFDHLKKVLSIAEKYGFHASMWSDMFFRLCYDGYYQVDPDTTSEPLKEVRNFVPENVDLIYWDYYHDEKPFYDAMFKKHRILSQNVQFACATWKWLGYVPLNRYGLDRLMPGLMSAADNKISEVLVTSWGDNGNEASTFSAIPQFVAAAEFAYRKKFNLNDIKKSCKEIMFANYDDFILLDIPNYIDCKEEKAEKYNPSKYLLYNDPIYGLYDYHTDNKCAEHYRNCTGILKKAGKRNSAYKEIFEMESALCDYLGVKANFGNTLKELYKADDKTGLKNFAEKTVPLKEMQDPDREHRKNALKAWSDLYESISAKLDDIYEKLVKIRCRQAKKLKYENYVQMVYAARSIFDYTKDDVKDFKELVVKYIVPVCVKLKEEQAKRLNVDKLYYYDESLSYKEGAMVPIGTSAELVEKANAMYDDMSKETGEFFTFMKENGYFDLETKPNKRGGGYCTELPKYKAPFIFSNFNGTSADVDVLTHEAGHAFAFYTAIHGDKDIYANDNMTMDIAEIHSMSMEHFAYPYMEKFFGDKAAKYRFAHLTDAFTCIPYLCAVDEFQHRVFADPNCSAADKRRIWKDIEEKFLPWRDYGDLPFLNNGGFWMQKQHVFLYPFYYIDYALSQICAFQFYKKELENHDAAWKDYYKLCSIAGKQGYFDTLKAVNLESPFKEETVKSVVAFVTRKIDELREKI